MAEAEEVISAEEMDPRIIEAFYRSLLESVKDKDLPMEPSDLLGKHIAEFSCAEFKLNFKFTSWKKIGKFLEVMDKERVIDYTEPTKNLGRKLVTKIDRSHPSLANFIPQFKLKRTKHKP